MTQLNTTGTILGDLAVELVHGVIRPPGGSRRVRRVTTHHRTAGSLCSGDLEVSVVIRWLGTHRIAAASIIVVMVDDRPTTTVGPTTSQPGSTTITRRSTTTTTAPTTTAPRSPFPPGLRGQDIGVVPTSSKVVALTFDAGANSAGLAKILRALAGAQVRATPGHAVTLPASPRSSPRGTGLATTP
ncbi:hypothetical protein [Actinophytocola sp. KF-1]